MQVKFYAVFVFIFLVLILISNVYALTGSLGNAKMFLNAEVGETLEKYVLVKNVNDVPVNIKLSVSSDISKDVKLEDEEFVLEPGEDRRVYFTIKARKAGTYEIRILVQFSEEGGKTGVGLSSVITLKVYGKGELPEDEENVDDTNLQDESEETDEDIGITGAFSGTEKKALLPVVLSLITTLILVLLLIFILRKAKLKKIKEVKLNKKKRSDRSS